MYEFDISRIKEIMHNNCFYILYFLNVWNKIVLTNVSNNNKIYILFDQKNYHSTLGLIVKKYSRIIFDFLCPL